MSKKPKSIYYRRKREGRTDYRQRMKTLLSGKPRLVCRRTGHNIICQVILFKEEGDKVACSAHSRELIKQGWTESRKNLPAAYLTGMLIAKKAKKARIREAVFDIGLCHAVSGSRVYAALAGAVDGGLKVPHSKECLPAPDRIAGKHIEAYRKNKITSQFEAVKSKLAKGE